MKWYGVLVILTLAACNNSANSDVKLDGIKKSVDTTVNRISDSVKSKSGQIEEQIRKKIEKGLDTTK
jgi:hypothetical protein